MLKSQMSIFFIVHGKSCICNEAHAVQFTLKATQENTSHEESTNDTGASDVDRRGKTK